MDLLTMLSEYRPRWSSQGNVVMDCPYHEKHTHRAGSGKHSMTIWVGIRVYKCFSCQTAGPAIGLLTEKLELDYFSVVEALNDLPELEDRERRSYELDKIIDLTPPKIYLRRGFPAELLRKHRVGKTTVTTEKGRTYKATVIPLYDQSVLRGLQYRVETDSGKMVWNTDGFNSAEFLYNHDPSKDEVIVVEGYADLWRIELWRLLHPEATLGTTITPGKVRLLRNRKIVYLAMDNDLPGIRATEKLYHGLRDYVDLRFVAYPGKDPDESSKRWFSYGIRNWLDYGAYSYQRLMEYQPDDSDDLGDNPYYVIQQQENRKALRDE